MNKKLFFTIILFIVALFTFAFLAQLFVTKIEESADILYKTKVDSIQKEYVIRLQEKDSLINLIQLREDDNKILFDEFKKLQNKIDAINKKPIVVPDKTDELADYINVRYDTKSTTVIQNKVALEKIVAKNVVTDLELKDRFNTIISLQEVKLFNNSQIISNLEKDKQDYKTIYTEAEKEINSRIMLQELADKNINQLKKDNSKLQKRNSFLKYAIPATAIIGGFVGFQISK